MGLADRDITVLRALTTSYWAYIGDSKRTYLRDGRYTAPRSNLRRLRDLGLIEVRTVTVDNWKAEPRIEDRQGSWVEARLTPQGADVRFSFTGYRIEPNKLTPWVNA